MLNKAYVIGDIAHFKPAMPKPINNAMPKPASNAMPKAQRLNDALKHLYVKPQWQKEPNDYGPFSFPKPIPLGGYGITDNVASNPASNTMPKPSGFQDTPEPQSFTKQQILQLNNIGQRNKMAMDPGYNPHYRSDKTSDAERRISVKPNTTNDENTMFPKALATAITATQQSGLPPAEFIRRLCGALGLDEEDLKRKDPKHGGGGMPA